MRSTDIVIFKNRYHHSLPCFALLWLALEDDERITSGSGLHFLSLIICINYMIESVQKEPRSRLDQGSIADREDRSRGLVFQGNEHNAEKNRTRYNF